MNKRRPDRKPETVIDEGVAGALDDEDLDSVAGGLGAVFPKVEIRSMTLKRGIASRLPALGIGGVPTKPRR